jgi:hypothetical protein
MKCILACCILALFASSAQASRCEISGDAVLWSIDSCFGKYETDDALHPGVVACHERNRKTIAKLGSCTAKRVFKERICRRVAAAGGGQPDPKTCMRVDQPLGPSVRNGGI